MTTYTRVPTGMTAEDLDRVFGNVADNGEAARQKAMATAVPHHLQPQWFEFYAQNLEPPEPDPTEATVKNADSVTVQWSGGQAVGGTASAGVTGGVLQYVRLNQPQGAVIRNNDPAAVQNADSSAAAGSPGAAVVAGSVLTAVRLTV